MERQTSRPWGHFEEMRPDQLEAVVRESPVVYWPLGLLEHHGWALPVGFDGVKAERFCERLARRTGGAVLPVMWWGGGGGHDEFKWTFYQQPDVGEKVLAATVTKLIECGFRAVVLVAGHYPWSGVMNRALTPISEANRDVLFLWGTECDIGGKDMKLPGDHAARWETAYGLALLPDLVDMDALRPGRGASSWPNAGPPPEERRFKGVEFDPAEPLFAQMGEDPRTSSSATEAEEHLGRLADRLVERVNAHLKSA